MHFGGARRLSSERMICQGACFEWVALNIMSRAREYSYQRRYDSISIGLSFHCRSGSSIRASKRRSCSSIPTSSQSLIRIMPPSMMYFSICGQSERKRLRSEEHTSELQSRQYLVCRLLLEKKERARHREEEHDRDRVHVRLAQHTVQRALALAVEIDAELDAFVSPGLDRDASNLDRVRMQT